MAEMHGPVCLLHQKMAFYLLRFFDLQAGLAPQLESATMTSVFRTEDGGQTWAKVTEITGQHNEHVTDLILTSPNDALMVGEGEMGCGYVVQLMDGGRTQRLRADLPMDLYEQSDTLGVFGDGTGHQTVKNKH
jgi:hypothetical protein